MIIIVSQVLNAWRALFFAPCRWEPNTRNWRDRTQRWLLLDSLVFSSSSSSRRRSGVTSYRPQVLLVRNPFYTSKMPTNYPWWAEYYLVTLSSSTVLSVGAEGQNKTDEDFEQCGYYFHLSESTNDTNSTDGIPDWQRYTMASIYLIFALLSSAIIVLFIDPLSR